MVVEAVVVAGSIVVKPFSPVDVLSTVVVLSLVDVDPKVVVTSFAVECATVVG